MARSNGGRSVSARVREIVVSREEKSKGGVRKCEERWSNCGGRRTAEKPSFVRGILRRVQPQNPQDMARYPAQYRPRVVSNSAWPRGFPPPPNSRVISTSPLVCELPRNFVEQEMQKNITTVQAEASKNSQRYPVQYRFMVRPNGVSKGGGSEAWHV